MLVALRIAAVILLTAVTGCRADARDVRGKTTSDDPPGACTEEKDAPPACGTKCAQHGLPAAQCTICSPDAGRSAHD